MRISPGESARSRFPKSIWDRLHLGSAPSGIGSMVGHVLVRAGIDSPRKGAHQFRHALACQMLRHAATRPVLRLQGHRGSQHGGGFGPGYIAVALNDGVAVQVEYALTRRCEI